MPYAKGSIAQATDYNALAGSSLVSPGSSAAATKLAGCLWGLGYGDRGYGQAAPALYPLGAGSLDMATAWQNLQSVITSLATWQGSSVSLLPGAGEFSSDVAVNRAFPTGNTPYSLVDMLTLVDTNRLNFQTANMALSAALATNTRATSWGLSGTGITGTLTATWLIPDGARFFFNTGGQVRIALNHPNSATTRDADWQTVLANFGSINFGAHTTTQTGSAGSDTTVFAVGYYGLTTSPQLIAENTSFPSPYTTNTVTITAQAASSVTTNGATCTQIIFTITMNDTYFTGSDNTAVAAGTNASIAKYLAGSSVILTSGIPNPTCAVGTNF